MIVFLSVWAAVATTLVVVLGAMGLAVSDDLNKSESKRKHAESMNEGYRLQLRSTRRVVDLIAENSDESKKKVIRAIVAWLEEPSN